MKRNFFFAVLIFISPKTFTQNYGEIHGNFQVDAQYYIPDTAIGADTVPEKMLMNAFANFIYTNGPFSAGVRFESYQNALLGFDSRYKGNGIPYRYVTYKSNELEITVGNYYEQFGSGLIFRSYEERGLGLDNAMDGLRIRYQPYKGIMLKGLVGKQRLYFSQGPGIVRGFDGEMQVNDVFTKLSEKKTRVVLGTSFVSKFQEQPTGDPLIYPENVGASAGRITLLRENLNFSGEYAYKINDPSSDNGFIYKPGEALLLSAGYFHEFPKARFNLSLSTKRVDNMYFRSDRTASINDLLINYLPALSRQHTYSLFAFYPYASQPNGEIAFQTELTCKIKKGTLMGGAYGMDISLNYSGANSLDTTVLNDMDTRRQGYKANFFTPGEEVYFRDVAVEINKKFNQKIKGTLMYAYQVFNIDVVQGKDGSPSIFSHTGLVDMTYKVTSDKAVRLEVQHLYTKQDHGSWAYGLMEWTLGSHWFIAVLDQYNYGEEHAYKRHHYYSASAGYIKNANRISLSYGKQRQGVFCVGGICRTVPASNGITLSISSSF